MVSTLHWLIVSDRKDMYLDVEEQKNIKEFLYNVRLRMGVSGCVLNEKFMFKIVINIITVIIIILIMILHRRYISYYHLYCLSCHLPLN